MDQGDTCSLKDDKKMDANTVWQWRIMHVKKYSRHPKPFHNSDKMGLDFNVGSNTQKKLDLHSVTNGIILEVCDFAEIVTKSKRHFITNILENNFDLGLKNERQRIEFTSQILHKVRDLIRQPPKDKHEAFTLFDTSSEPECTCNGKNELNVASDSFLVDMDDTDRSEHEDELKCSRAPSKVTIATEKMDGPHADDSDDDDDELINECSEPQSTEELKEDVLPPSFPCCEEIGLNLDVGSKQSLDPGLLTKGMMLELVHFTGALTASYKSIVLSVLEHNFELDIQSQQERNQVWFKVSDLLKRRERLITVFQSEPFSFQTDPFKRQSALSNVGAPLHQFKEATKRRQSDLKRKQEQRALSVTREHATKRCRTEQEEGEHIYKCPLDSDEVTDSENEENEYALENPISSDIHSETESTYLGAHGPFFTTTDDSYSFPIVYSYVNSPFASQPDEGGLCGDEEKTEIHDSESNMWKLRVNRVEQILSQLDKAFTKSKTFGLEFNVGFGPKQNFSVDSLTTFVLLEVAKFALAMNSSQQDFIMEILEYNFDFGLWSEQQRKTFACEVMNRVRQLKNSEDSVKLSKQVFQLPGLVSSVNIANQNMDRVNPEVSSISRTAECDVAPLCPPDTHTETKEHRVELYPFCKDIGLKLNVISSQPNKKLELNKLTNGAMMEVTNFAEKLCGTFEQICLDILRHNFDLDCQNGDSDLAKNILARIPVIMEHKNLSNLIGCKYTMKDFSTMVMDFKNSPNLDPCSSGSSQAPIIDQNVVRSTDINQEDVLNLVLWKCRANQIQRILSMPHGEHCPLYAYSRSKKLGIDFNVGSGVKQNLDPKLLTNGIMVEVGLLAAELVSAERDFITEILEYNFHLNLNNELCRSVFAEEVMAKIRGSALKTSKSSFMKLPFELPCSRLIDDSAYSYSNDCPKCYRDRNDKLHQDESDPDHMLHPSPHALAESASAKANCTPQKSAKDLSSAFQAVEETIMDSYPLCKKTGLSLCVDKNKPKVKLNTCVLTRGVMKEVISFAKRLCGTNRKLINDVLEHNFNFGIQSRDINPALQFHHKVFVPKKGPTWFSEIVVVYPHPHRDPRDVSIQKEVSAAQKIQRKETIRKRQLALQKKREESTLQEYKQSSGHCYPICKEKFLELDLQNPTNTLFHHTDVCTSQTVEGDHRYMCPLDSDEVTDSENDENEDYLQNPTSSDIHSESESSCLGVRGPFLTTTDGSSSLPFVNSNVNSSSASQPDERELCGDEEKTQIPRNVPYKYDMKEEEMETESNMWKLRATRVEQILSLLDKAFIKSKAFGLEFNVGFGPKQNFSVDSLTTFVLLEVAKFALTMNSCQQDFIMEILEYNFDFGLWSEQQRKTFACEVMNRVRQLKNSEDSVKLSKQVFQLPGPVSSVNIANQNMDRVNPEVSSISRTAECDVAPLCPPDSHTETKEHRVELYPFCKDIGLKLNVISSQPNKKLELNKLTNGAMTEVTNFAEKLCGTFEQICLDILRHNFNLDGEHGDSDLAKNILARIPVIMDHKNLSNLIGRKYTINDFSWMVMDRRNSPNLDTCSSGSSQAPIRDQNVVRSTDINQENVLNLMLWKCRANLIQQILSVPHVEHCPLYSYSRSKELSIDFNVGSGVKQNLDPKLLTNGLMVEVSTLAAALFSAQKDFILDILEYNFHLNLNSELCRSVFSQQVVEKMRASSVNPLKSTIKFKFLKMPFELPDSRFIDESTYLNTDCPKCYQDRNYKFHQDESAPDHVLHPRPHALTESVSAEANYTAQKAAKDLSSAFQAAEETMMDRYPLCKKIGLSLCVEINKPKIKLNTCVLTRGVMKEVAHFAKRLCGTNRKLINDVLDHNFNFAMQSRDINPAAQFHKKMLVPNKEPTWFSEIVVVYPHPHRDPRDVSIQKEVSAVQKIQRKETIRKRQLALQRKREESTLQSEYMGAFESKDCKQSSGDCYPICTEIFLELDLQNPTNTLFHHTDVCTSQTAEGDHRYMCPLDSDEVTDSENEENEYALENLISSDIHSETESTYLGTHGPFFTATDGSSSLPLVNSNGNSSSASQPDERGLCGDEEKTQIPRNVQYKCDTEEEEMETESHMWKLRATCVEQILSLLDKAFTKSQTFGLEFNVGFGPKQNFSVDSLTTFVLLEVAKFALTMNSCQQDFIMEILEYNFDFGLWSEQQRKTFACEVMNRVRQLKKSEDSVKLSKQVFQLPGPVSSVNIANQNMGRVNPEVSSISRTTECDVAPLCPPDTHTETKEHRVELYPFCKDIGLKLNVISSQPNEKLELNKLTNGAMTEVTNFAEKLCGTFEQICLDILRHNFDHDWQNGDSDLAKNILTQIPVIMEQKNLSTCITASKKIKHTIKDFSAMVMDWQNSPNLDTCSTSSSQAPIRDQNVVSSTDNNQENQQNLFLWKLRANQIQQFLSVPHGEHCLFYSYPRCKKLGIDFNVGSGVKQNLDPKLLTNGLMVEINTLATALHSAQKYFITEILEYNFHLNLNNELCRSVFAQQVLDKFRTLRLKNRKSRILKMVFELPDSRCIEKSSYPKTKYCPKCYQDRNDKLRQNKADPDHVLHPSPHALTESISAETNCTAQKSAKDLSSAFQAAEETIMDSYPLCKKTGLSLCVDKGKPKDKLDTRVLTRGVMTEVVHFARRLCGTKHKLMNDVLEHNFNFGMQGRDINPALLFHRMAALHNKGPTWFSEVFVVQPYPHKDPGDMSKLKEVSSTQKNERKETTKKRKLALQTKEQATLPIDNTGVVKSKRNQRIRGVRFPVCSEIGLDLDVTSNSGDKEKLDLKLLTRAAVMEIYRFAVKKVGHYFPGIVYDILDYNFDISSQHYRHWEFSIATATKIKTMVKQYRKNIERADEVFKLPFLFNSKASQRFIQERQNKKSAESNQEKPEMTTTGEGRFVRQIRYHSDFNRVYFLDVKTNEELCFDEEDTKSQRDPGTMMQMTGSSVSEGCESLLQGNLQIKEEEDDPHYGDMEPEPDTEEKYHPPCEDVKTEPSTDDVKYLIQGEPAGSLGYNLLTICPKSESNVKTESETEDAQYYNLAEPQVSEGYAMLAVHPKTESSVKTELNTEGIKSEIKVEAAGSQGYSMITICQDTESTSIKEEQENVSVIIVEMFETQSEVDMNQE